MRATQLTAPVAEHAEGPVWAPTLGGLCWVDMMAGDVLTLDGYGVVSRRHVGSVAAVVRPRADGGAIVATERGFTLIDADDSRRALPDVVGDEGVRLNEGGCDPAGRFYCGSMDTTGGRRGRLYRVDADLSVRVVAEGIGVSNGLDWTPDGRLAYYADTSTGRVDVFDDDGTSLRGRRTAFVVEPDDGAPDGLTVDAQGGVWVALWGGSCVRRYTPDGIVDAVVELPVTQVTACTFAGPGLDELVVTTSRQGLSAGEQPSAGALFTVRPGVVGQAVRPFSG